MLGGGFLGLEPGQSLNDRIQILQKALALRNGETRENAFVDTARQRIVRFQNARTLLGDLDGIGPGVVARPPPLQHALLQHAPDDVRQRRPIDARQLDELRLIQSLILRNREQNSVLPRRQPVGPELDLKHLGRALASSVKKMKRRPFKTVMCRFPCHSHPDARPFLENGKPRCAA
ncbi:hypothetical protein HYPGJ_10189 [Hyphomicrobium sp. GJ21]|nr:hypothetical protein HYPGJ_10189 [Hyphomicrobium sp. GJ21]